MGNTQRIHPSKVREDLQNKIIGCPILYFRDLTSTNHMAKELAMRSAREGTVIVSETQTKGRGRLKREWVSPEGGLWLSIILRPKTKPKYASLLTLLASVAVAKAINGTFELETDIKWPNDVLVNQKKVCGILTEARTKGEALDFAVVGIGINANFNIDALPTHLWDSSTTLKEELKKNIERETLLTSVLQVTESYYRAIAETQFDCMLADWRAFAGFLGSQVEIESNGEKVDGRAIDIDSDGALIVKIRDGTTQRVLSGDLRVIKKIESK